MEAGAFVSTAGKPLSTGALVDASVVATAPLMLELVDCVSVELTGVF
jgi:hypothetical protein